MLLTHLSGVELNGFIRLSPKIPLKGPTTQPSIPSTVFITRKDVSKTVRNTKIQISAAKKFTYNANAPQQLRSVIFEVTLN